MKRIKMYKFVPGIAWFFIVLVLMCLPGKDIPSNNWFNKIYFDKWVHTGVFGLLALLFMLPVALSPINNKKKLQYFIRIAIASSVWGLTIEFIQKYWIPGRSFDLFDWAADSLGAVIAFIACKKKYI
jgi:VanZ family protein